MTKRIDPKLLELAKVHAKSIGSVVDVFVTDAEKAIELDTFDTNQGELAEALLKQPNIKSPATAKKEANQLATVAEVAMLGLPAFRAILKAAENLPTTHRFYDRDRDNYLGAMRAVKRAMWLDEDGNNIPRSKREYCNVAGAWSVADVTTVVTEGGKAAHAKRKELGKGQKAKKTAKQYKAAVEFLTALRAAPGCAKGIEYAINKLNEAMGDKPESE